MAIDNIYLWIEVLPIMNSQKSEPQEVMNFYSHMFSRTLACIFSWTFYIQLNDLMEFTNMIFEMEKYFEGT